jgi:hypothetical protein
MEISRLLNVEINMKVVKFDLNQTWLLAACLSWPLCPPTSDARRPKQSICAKWCIMRKPLIQYVRLYEANAMNTLSPARCITMLLLLLLPGLWGCDKFSRSSNSTGEVGLALKKELLENQVKEVDIAKLTRFAWDELFLFSPYFPTSEVCKRVQLSVAECKSTIPEESTDDGEMMMVFRIKGKVAHSELHHRQHGDFTPAPSEPFTPETAIFSVVAEGTGVPGPGWMKLRPKSASAL